MFQRGRVELGDWVIGAVCESREAWEESGRRFPALVAGAAPVTGWVVGVFPELPTVAVVDTADRDGVVVMRYPNRAYRPIPPGPER